MGLRGNPLNSAFAAVANVLHDCEPGSAPAAMTYQMQQEHKAVHGSAVFTRKIQLWRADLLRNDPREAQVSTKHTSAFQGNPPRVLPPMGRAVVRVNSSGAKCESMFNLSAVFCILQV